MPAYLIQASYTSEGWKAQLDNTDDRLASVSKMIQDGGGKVVALYYSFGASDVVGIAEWPSNQDAASFAIAVASSGALKSYQTTPLMTAEEGTQAIRAAGKSNYRPPS
jgi:uncharacterized protein with GYD domain